MSDERLRELERRWGATGAPEDEANYLRERVRVGALSKDRLRAAAGLGSIPACAALELPADFGEMSWPHALDFAQEKPVEAFAIAIILREMARAAGLQFRMDMALMRDWLDHPQSETLEMVISANSLNATDAVSRGPEWNAIAVGRMEIHLTGLMACGRRGQLVAAVAYCKGAEGVFAFLREPAFKQTMARHMIPALLGYPAPPGETTSG